MVRALGLSLLLLASCETYDLESEGQIYRPRILAMRIDPPEARIGDTVRVTPLVATPVGFDGVIDATWLDCFEVLPRGDGGDSHDWCKDRAQERVISTTDELVYTVPQSLPQQLVRQLSFTAGYWKRLTLEIKDRFGGDQDRAFKRLVVQPPPLNPQDPMEQMRFDMLRNRNPNLPEVELSTLNAQRQAVAVDSSAPMLANTDYLFRFTISKEARQDYKVVVLDLSGIDPSAAQQLSPEELEERVRVEDRREAMLLRFYRTDGRFGRDQKPVRTVDSTADDPEYYPAEITWGLNTKDRQDPLPERVRLWFVLVDGRGGMDWLVWDRAFELGAAPARAVTQPIQSPPDLNDRRPSAAP